MADRSPREVTDDVLSHHMIRSDGVHAQLVCDCGWHCPKPAGVHYSWEVGQHWRDPILAALAAEGGTSEVRTLVYGWKGSRDNTFCEVSYGDGTDYYTRRIGDDACEPDWQPHITGFVVQRREVTEWVPVGEQDQ